MMKKKTRLAIIGTVGLPSNYGGFETLADQLTDRLSNSYDISVYCSGARYAKDQRQKYYKGARLFYMPLKANGLQSIIYDAMSMLHALFVADVLLVLGVSGSFLIPFIRFFTGKRIITSIDGLEWKRNKWSKSARWFLWASEWIAVKFSHANIADNESIQDYTAMRYNKRSNIIEYGGDHVTAEKPTALDINKYPFLSRSYAVKVCRIEPENNIEMVLKAFSQLHAQLVLVGNWNNSEYGVELRKKYANHQNITMLDPIYEQREINMIRGNASVYIHGHSAGGTNPSLVEAMSLQLPVIAYGVNYNRTTTEERALYFKSDAELANIIRRTTLTHYKAIGAEMKTIADRRYRWDIIADKYHFLVESIKRKSYSTSLQPAVAGLRRAFAVHYGLAHLQHSSMFYEKR